MSIAFLERALLSLDGVYDDDEPVDEFDHALQCATRAQAAGSDPDLITAALLHDIARSPLIAPLRPGITHERCGAEWLLPIFGERVSWLVGAHVAAKLYLLDTDAEYAGQLSAASKRSAVLQRDTLDESVASHQWFADALALRRFDDAAKDPSLARLDPIPFLELASRLVRAA